MKQFIIIAEKIHASRKLRVTNPRVVNTAEGPAFHYELGGEGRFLSIPAEAMAAAGEKGMLPHCDIALKQGMAGNDDGWGYLQSIAISQQENGADYLDINIDQAYSRTADQTVVITRVVEKIREVTDLPLSIDSSNPAVLAAGLAAMEGAPAMLNSISLERLEATALLEEYRPAVVCSLAGESDLPRTTPARLVNLDALLAAIQPARLDPSQLFIDPLIFPVASNEAAGVESLEAIAAIREKLGPDVHITGGLSNVSFGLPKRGLINRVFTQLAIKSGVDSGIVDPAEVNPATLASLKPSSEAVKLTQALLLGEDPYGEKFIQAFRDGALED